MNLKPLILMMCLFVPMCLVAQLGTLANVIPVKANSATFTRLYAVKLKELGKQCFYKTTEDYLAAEKEKSDPDLQLTTEQFDRSIAFLGDNSENYSSLYEAQFLEKPELCFMNKNEITALMMYSMSTYRKLNSALRSQDAALLGQFSIYIKTLNSALDKIKNYEGFVKRGAGTVRERFDDHQIGGIVKYPSYTSTSVGSGFDGVARSVIYSKTCKYIAPFSLAPAEEEVLCKPGTQFKVIYRQDKLNVIHLMLEEVVFDRGPE